MGARHAWTVDTRHHTLELCFVSSSVRSCIAMAPVGLLLIVVNAAAMLLAPPAGAAALPRVVHAPKADGTLAILAVGDWGRRGQFNQTLVAQQVT